MQLVLCKDNASERQVSLLTVARVQLVLCKDNASEWQVSLLTVARVQLILCKDTKFFLLWLARGQFLFFRINNTARVGGRRIDVV